MERESDSISEGTYAMTVNSAVEWVKGSAVDGDSNSCLEPTNVSNTLLLHRIEI